MAIKKTDFGSLKKKFSTSAKYKPQRFFDLGEPFNVPVFLYIFFITNIDYYGIEKERI
jgi:hypothetical protein